MKAPNNEMEAKEQYEMRKKTPEHKRTFEDFCEAVNGLYAPRAYARHPDGRLVDGKGVGETLLALIHEYRHEILDALLEARWEERENIDCYKQAEAEEARRFSEQR